MNKNGITIIHKHFVVWHHLGLLPHPWGRLHASATELFKIIRSLLHPSLVQMYVSIQDLNRHCIARPLIEKDSKRG